MPMLSGHFVCKVNTTEQTVISNHRDSDAEVRDWEWEDEIVCKGGNAWPLAYAMWMGVKGRTPDLCGVEGCESLKGLQERISGDKHT